MKRHNAVSKALLIILPGILLMLTSCNNDKNNNKDVFVNPKLQKKNINLEQVTMIQYNENSSFLYSIKGIQAAKIGELKDVVELNYNVNKDIYACVINKAVGTELNNNTLEIYSKGKWISKEDYYSFLDISLSPTGQRLAVRAFDEDSYQSAQGVLVYNLDEDKYEQIKSKVNISGSNYVWLSDNEILYYGIKIDKENSNCVYKYDFQLQKEEKFFNIVEGACTKIIPLKDKSVLFMINTEEGAKLFLVNNEGVSTQIASDLINIYSNCNNYENLVYFIGEDGDGTYLYEFDSNNSSIRKVTYDYPNTILNYRGIAVDKFGRVYFCGLQEEEEDLCDVYMYEIKDNSVNIITEEKGDYYLFSSN